MSVKEFVATNKNNGVKWDIDGTIFDGAQYIPSYLMEKYVFDWYVNQARDTIVICTHWHE